MRKIINPLFARLIDLPMIRLNFPASLTLKLFIFVGKSGFNEKDYILLVLNNTNFL